jgi:hypothetical protein
MCNETREFLFLSEGMSTLGDIYDVIWKEHVSEVMLEGKVWGSWYGRPLNYVSQRYFGTKSVL